MSRSKTDELLAKAPVAFDATGDVDVEGEAIHETITMRQQMVELREQLEAEQKRLAELRRAIEADHDLVRKLGAEGRPLNAIAAAAVERNQWEARAAFYKSVSGRKVTIQLHTHEDPRRNYPVHLSLNGVVHEVPRGVPYTIPGEFLSVLDEARLVSTTKEIDEAGNAVLRHYDHLSYPYVILQGIDHDSLERIAASA